MIHRRAFVMRIAGLFAAGVTVKRLSAQVSLLGPASTPITVYKSSTCGCCAKWVDHLRANGFATTVRDEEKMDQIKDQLGVPQTLRSCHTAVLDKYLVEGHVPAADLHRLLSQRPKVAGLAVPGMPSRSPGMAGPGDKIEGFEVVAFQADGGSSTFARY